MIYIVEEQKNLFISKIRMLRTHGYDVRHFQNAEVAWKHLYNAADIDLVIIDVMLAAGKRYSQQETNGYQTTGVSLARDLVEQRSNSIHPKRLLLFTSASRPDIVAAVRKAEEEYGINAAFKSAYRTLTSFLDLIDGLVERAGGKVGES